MSQFRVSPCDPSDLDAMCSLFIIAFGPALLNQITYPPSTCSYDSKMSWLRIRFGALFSKRELKMYKAVETSTGRLVAWARWGVPTLLSAEELAVRQDVAAHEAKEIKEGTRKMYPEGANDSACQAMFSGIGAMQQKWVVGEEMYVLHLLATDPVFERRGLGTMLMQEELKNADRERKQVYLEASDEGHLLYKRLGWKDVDHLDFDLTAWGGTENLMFWVMLREPLGSQQSAI